MGNSKNIYRRNCYNSSGRWFYDRKQTFKNLISSFRAGAQQLPNWPHYLKYLFDHLSRCRQAELGRNPIYCSPGKGGGIFLMKDFVLDKALFSESERDELLAAPSRLPGF